MIRFLIIFTSLLAKPSAVTANIYEDCQQKTDLSRRISGCTKIIKRGKQEKRSTRSLAYGRRGIAYLFLEDPYDPRQSVSDLSRAIRLSPNDAESYNIRGTFFMVRGDAHSHLDNHESAIADYTKAIEILPNKATLYYKRGSTYYAKAQAAWISSLLLRSAMSDFKMALQIDSNHALTHREIGRLHNDAGKFALAEKHCAKAVSIDPSFTQAYRCRGQAFLHQAKLKSAISNFS